MSENPSAENYGTNEDGSENSYTSTESAQETNTGTVSDTGAEPTDGPTAYDREQDSKLSEKDAEIARLTAALEAMQAQVAPPDAVVSNQTPGLESPTDTPRVSPADEAQFHEVPAAPSDSDPGTQGSGSVSPDAVASAVVDELTTRGSEQETVNVNPAPELSDHTDDGASTHAETVRNQEELKEAVGEILTLVREIHETVAWVKGEAPKIGAALAASPFGKMLPSFVNGL